KNMKSVSKARFVLRFSLALFTFCFIILKTTSAQADPGGARTVKYSQQDVIPVRAKLRFSTLIVLPANEEILDFATGDKEFWIINGAHNLCYVHPAQAGIRSDLHLITSTGHVCSFLLTEVSNDRSLEPDLKLFVEPEEESAIRGSAGFESYVRAGEAEAYKKELEALRAETDSQIRLAELRAADEVAKFRADYPGKLQFDYELDRKAAHEPFRVSIVYHDETFTYI